MQNQNPFYADRLLNESSNDELGVVELEIEIGLLGDFDSDFENTVEMLKKKNNQLSKDDLFEDSLNCDDFGALMGEYIDGEIRGKLKTFFESHKKSCKKCSDGFELYKAVVEIAPTLDSSGELEINVPESFFEESSANCSSDPIMSSEIADRIKKNLFDKFGIK